jgi:DNA mismatch endonuclease (patch repair protein)
MDVFSKKKRSVVMSGIRSKNNRSTELAFRKLLKDMGITGWRRHYRITGKPDFAFPVPKIAVFIDGCFWHRCPFCFDGHIPKQNQEYWTAKLSRNKRRDTRISRSLRARGWRVFRIRECGIVKRKPAVSTCLRILERAKALGKGAIR